jgi:hypothetical protein
MYGILEWKEPSKLTIDKFAIFNEVEFESRMDDVLYQLQNMIAKQNALNIVIEKIINATEPYDH